MRKGKKTKLIAITISLFLVLLGGLVLFLILNNNSSANDDSEYRDFDDNLNEEKNNLVIDATEEEIENYVNYDYGNIDVSSEDSEISYIYLNENSIEADDSVEVKKSVAYIMSGGTYIISGTLDEGQIIVSSEDEETVKIIFNDVDITSLQGSPISIENAEETIIILKDGTVNYITDNSEYVDPDTDEDATTAAIFSRDDLYIGGSGELVINSENKNGIQSKDQLVILEGIIKIDARKEAIKAKDYIVIEGGNLDLTAGEDGISVTEDEDVEKGYIVISGGTIEINSQQDGITAKTYILIKKGNIDITTNSEATDKSAKGIKSDYYIEINDGVINIDSKDDGIHSNNKIVINGGLITISSGDDGIHSDELIEINNGEINIEKSIEGIEAKNIYLNNGEISIVSSDDGINVADSSISFAGEQAISGAALYINGGYLYVNANGDGLDSNGDMYITEGTIIVNGPTNNGNGGLDVNGECIIEGGFLVVASSSGMAESPDQTSQQNSVLIIFSSTIPAGTLIHVESSDGTDIVTFAPAKSFQAIVISSEDLETGETYKVYTGGSTTGSEINGLYAAEDYNTGSLYTEFTITSPKTSVGTAGMGDGMPGGGVGSRRGLR